MLIPIFRGLVSPDGVLHLRETEKAKRRKEQRVRTLHRPDVREKSRRSTIQRGIEQRAAKRQQRGEG